MTGGAKAGEPGHRDICSKCDELLSPSARACDVCGTDAGFPNVRYANRQIEVNALQARVAQERIAAEARGAGTELAAFELALTNSVAIMNRRIGQLSQWLNGQGHLWVNYYQQSEVLGRHPDGSNWDEQREAAEAAVSPHFHRELTPAALSLDGVGMSYYGDYSVTLKTLTIEDRASVFEENPFIFNDRHHVIAGKPPPVGYRASWSMRADLSVAKLGNKIESGMDEPAFAALVMGPDRTKADCDFIEVHVYGAISRQGIDRVAGPVPEDRAEKLLWGKIKRSLSQLGVVVEETK